MPRMRNFEENRRLQGRRGNNKAVAQQLAGKEETYGEKETFGTENQPGLVQGLWNLCPILSGQGPGTGCAGEGGRGETGRLHLLQDVRTAVSRSGNRGPDAGGEKG